MEESWPADAAADTALWEAAHQQLQQQVAAPGLRLPEARALLAEALTQQQALLGEIRQLRATVRQPAAQARPAAEEQFRLFAAASLNPVYKMSADWHQMYQLAGQAFLADTPAPTESWLRAYIPAADWPAVSAAIEHAIQTKSVFELEHPVFQADGSVGWVHSRAVPVLDDRGELLEWLGTGSDITARRRAEQGLQASRELLQATLDSSLDMVQVFEAERDEAGDIVDFSWTLSNEAAGKFTGPVIGQRLLTHNPGVVEAGVFDIYRRVVETGQPDQTELHYTGEQLDHWFLQSTVKLHDGVVATHADITARKQAGQGLLRLQEEIAKQAQNIYRTLFATISEGFCLIELLLNARGAAVDYRFLEVNEVFERQTGLTDVAGRLSSSVAPNEEPHWLETYARVVRTGQSEHLDNYHQATGRWYSTYISRVDGGSLHQVCVVFNDITERRQHEQRQQFLLQLSDALRPLADPTEIQRAAMRVLGEYLRVDRAFYAEITPDGETVVMHDNYLSGRFPAFIGAFSVASYGSITDKIRNGEQVIVADIDQEAEITELEKSNYKAIDCIAAVVTPLLKGGRWVANLVVQQGAPRRWTNEETALLRETAERTWAAVERARAEAALRQSEEKYRSLFESIDEGFSIVELLDDEQGQAVDFCHLEVNPAHEKLTGLVGAVGRTARELLPAPDAAEWVALFDAVARTGEAQRLEKHIPGLHAWFDVHNSRVGGPGSRRVASVFNNITERKRAELNLNLLNEASEDLVALTDVDATMNALCARLGEYFGATVCAFSPVDEAAGTVAVQHVWHQTGAPRPAGVYCLSEYHSAEVQQAMRAGRPDVVRDTADLPAAVADQLAALHIGAYINLPFVRQGQWLFTLSLTANAPRDWRADELDLLRELTVRIWTRLEHARAEETLRRSEARIRRQKEAFQSAINGEPLANALNRLAIMAKEQLNDEVRTVFYLAYPDGARLHAIEGASDLPESYTQPVDGFPIGEDSFCSGLAIATGQPALTRDVREDPKWEAHRPLAAAHGFRACSSYPILTREGQAIGSFALYFPAVHEATPQELAVAEAVTQAAAIILARHTEALERARAEEALRHSEEQFRTVANLVPDLLWRTETDNNTTWYNQRWLDYTGQTLADAAGDGWAGVIHPDDRERSARQYRTAVQTGQLLQQEYRIRSAQGEYRWFVVNALPAHDAQGTITHWFGAATDIEVQKRAEAGLRTSAAGLEAKVARRTQALHDSRDLFQSVFDTNLILMAVFRAVRDEAGTIQDFEFVSTNREFERDCGRTNLAGRRYAEEFPGVRTTGIFGRLVQAMETGQPQTFEHHYSNEGLDAWYVSQFVKLGDGVVATNLNITERKAAEHQLTSNLRLLEQAEAVAQLGSWDYNLATGQFLWSAGMYQLFGLPLGQPVQPPIYLDYVLEEDRPLAERLVQQIMTGTGDFETTLRLQVGDAIKTVRIKSVVLRNEQDQAVRVLGVDLDLSELHRLEADNLRLRLRQQQALFEAVQAAGEEERRRMSESLHNGIGQLLYATKLQLDLLPSGPAPGPRQQAANLLGEAIRQTRALSHELTPAILEDFGLEKTLQSMCGTLNGGGLAWRCHLHFDEGPALPMPVQLAVYRLAQELAQNVLKHAHATNATLEVDVLPAWVVLRVEDDGRGFDPTQTGDGLGLRSLRSRAALLGGSVHLTTAPGEGTQCQIRIPIPTAFS